MKFVDALSTAMGNTAPVPYVSGRSSNVISGYGGARGVLVGAMGSNGTLFATVSRYAGSTALVNWELFRKAKSGDPEQRRQITSHLALDVWAMPNPFNTQQQFVESTQQHLELVGESWWIIARNEFGWPETLWLVRPDRMQPIPSTTFGLAGYVYNSPDGDQIPFPIEDVIWMKQPNPADPGPAGRGLGAAQTIIAQIEAVTFSQQWNRNFFANSAVPGGIITVPTELSDESFRRLRDQWGERHKGINNAHRVAVIEGGATWNDGPTQKDMEFSNLLNTGRDVIREAYSMPKFMLGLVEDVNRATADASDASFGTWGLVPRLERIKQALNTRFLPQFGPSGHGTGAPDVEFDYCDPVPKDAELANATLTTKVNALAVLIGTGVDPSEAALTVGLPEMTVTLPPPVLPGAPSVASPTHPVHEPA